MTENVDMHLYNFFHKSLYSTGNNCQSQKFASLVQKWQDLINLINVWELFGDPIKINRSHSHLVGFSFPSPFPRSFKYNSHSNGNPIPMHTSTLNTLSLVGAGCSKLNQLAPIAYIVDRPWKFHPNTSSLSYPAQTHRKRQTRPTALSLPLIKLSSDCYISCCRQWHILVIIVMPRQHDIVRILLTTLSLDQWNVIINTLVWLNCFTLLRFHNLQH